MPLYCQPLSHLDAAEPCSVSHEHPGRGVKKTLCFNAQHLFLLDEFKRNVLVGVY